MTCNMKKEKLPTLVRKLCYHCDGYIVGGAADYILGHTDKVKDYDVIVPFNNWKLACSYTTSNTEINSFGGFKQKSDGFKVDFWTDDVINVLTDSYKNEPIYAVKPYDNIILSSKQQYISFY